MFSDLETQTAEPHAVGLQALKTQILETLLLENHIWCKEHVDTQALETRVWPTLILDTHTLQIQSLETMTLEAQILETPELKKQWIESCLEKPRL